MECRLSTETGADIVVAPIGDGGLRVDVKPCKHGLQNFKRSFHLADGRIETVTAENATSVVIDTEWPSKANPSPDVMSDEHVELAAKASQSMPNVAVAGFEGWNTVPISAGKVTPCVFNSECRLEGISNDDVQFKITHPNPAPIKQFIEKLLTEFSTHPLLNGLSLSGVDHAAEAIEQSVGDEKGIVRRIRHELIDSLVSAFGEHIADGSEISKVANEGIV